MSQAYFFRAALFSVAALLIAPACSSDASEGGGSAQQSVADVLREGDATEAELRAFVGIEPRDWAWAGGAFDAPGKDKQVLPAASPFEFAYTSDVTVAEGGAPSNMEMAHLLVFSSATQGTLARVFTTLNTYTPSAEVWQKLVAAGDVISINISSATFIDGALSDEDSGPFAGQTLTFTID